MIKNKNEFYDFLEKWKSYDSFYLFGYSSRLKAILPSLEKEIKIIGILDNDVSKQGAVFRNIKVISPDILRKEKGKVIVFSYSYHEISQQLQSFGLIEDVDFCGIIEYMGAINALYERIYIDRVQIAVTMECNLKCKDCVWQISKCNNSSHFDLNAIKEDIISFFNIVHRIGVLDLLGGEPFLWPYLRELIRFVIENYSNRLDDIFVTTNGTIIPDDSLLAILSKHRINILISDYSTKIPYQKRISELIDTLRKYDIPHTHNKIDDWADFKLNEELNLSPEELIEHYRRCNFCRSISNGKFYTCQVLWAAVHNGTIEDNPNDYVKYSELDKESWKDKLKLIAFNLKMGEALSLCKKCRGIDSNYVIKIDAAIQDVSHNEPL